MITDHNYLELLKDYTVVLVTTSTCASCFGMSSDLEIICKEMNFNFYVLNADIENENFITEFDVKRAPTILFFQDNDLIGKVSGYQPSEIIKIWFEAKIEEREEVKK